MADLEDSHATLDHTGLTGVGGGGGIATGTSFPGSPATNDMIFRTDRGFIYYYDGTRWLTVQQFTIPFSMEDALVNNSVTGVSGSQFDSAGRASIPWFGVYGLWLTEFVASYRVDTTNNGTHYWQVSPRWIDATDTADNYLVTVATSATTAGQYGTIRGTIDAALNSGARILSVAAYKNGTPGTLKTLAAALSYRLVG